MEFRVLGPLEVYEEGRPIELGGARQRALLAILLTRANQVVSRDRLIDDLFGEEPRDAAAGLLQVYVSRLRKALEPGRERRRQTGIVVTKAPGYYVHVEPDQLDLERFERLAEEGRRALAAAPDVAHERLVEALSLWRGPALAEFAFEPFAHGEARRLEELRLTALEDRIEAGLALGRHAALVGELEALVDEHPFRERLRGQLMLALYRSGRQAEALDVYQTTRRALVEDLGIEPGAPLQELERAILRQDASLGLEPAVTLRPPERSLLLVPGETEEELAALVRLAEPLALVEPRRELVLARIVAAAGELVSAVAGLHTVRDELLSRGVPTRAAGFTSGTPAEDVGRLATEQDVDLVLVAGNGLVRALPGGPLGEIVRAVPCDVGALATSGREEGAGPIVVPFGGADHDWAALELAAWLAAARRLPLRLVGPVGDPDTGQRDASRLLARASLLVQRLAGVAAEPALGEPGSQAVIAAAGDAALLVVGLSARWQDEGVGPTRAALIEESPRPVVLTARGIRPGGLAPNESLTRFSWSLREVDS